MTAFRWSASATVLVSFLLIRPCAAQSTRTPVLIELFTSEGCSSCPPADALLAKLEREQPVAGAEIIALGEHVDYWDSLGWRDRFSSHQFTERQNQYSAHFHLNDIYTPQMVVNGNAQFVGNDERAARKAILTAAQGKAYVLVISDLHAEANHISASLRIPAGIAGRTYPNQEYGFPPDADFYAALVSPHQSTAVRAGENGGRTLQHVAVVRSLMRLGDTATFQKSALPISFDAKGISGPLRVVVFAQAVGTGQILGATSTLVPNNPSEAVTTR